MWSTPMRWAKHVARMAESLIQGLGGGTWCKRPLLRPNQGLEDNIKKYIQEIGWEDVDWIDVTQDRAK